MESTPPLNSPKPRNKGFSALIPFLFLLLLGVGGGLWKAGFGQKKSFDLSNYTVSAEKGRLPGTIKASGEMKAIRSVNISSERQGLLAELYVIEGEKVEKNQLLAKMDGGDYKFRLGQVQADFLTESSAFNRRKILFQEGAISKDEYEEYLNRFLSSQARLNQIKVEGDEFDIRAPFSGTITTRFSEPGSFVAPTTRVSSVQGSTSASIVELSQGLEVIVKVPESDIGRIQVGQTASFRTDAFPDKRFQAKVSEIAPRASQVDNVTSFEVTLSLSNISSVLRIGMNADVEFQTGQTAESILVPTVAIVTENGQPGILIVDNNQKPRFQKVELGTSSGSRTSIVNGVNSGDLIFIDLPPGFRKKSN